MSGTVSLHCASSLHCISLALDALHQPAAWKNSALGAHVYTTDVEEIHRLEGLAQPCMLVPMPCLDAGGVVCEVWHGSETAKQGQFDSIHFHHNGDVLFGVIVLAESKFSGSVDKAPLQQATEAAYRQIFSLLEQLQYPHLYRLWNYIPDINVHDNGLERYVQFNLGRQDAFLAHGRAIVGNVPAACALGFGQKAAQNGALIVSFLAGRVAPLSIENPRQISAYLYPQQYGPRSPTFARACLVELGQESLLFISGTASIVGHATLHVGDVVAQTRETVANIQAVLTEANRQLGQPKFDLSSLYYKVYIRHSADLEQVRNALLHCVGEVPKAVYLKADICRQDLLLEIEATAGHSMFFQSEKSD